MPRNKRERLNILGIDLDSLVKKYVIEETAGLKGGEKDLQKAKASELEPFRYREGDDSEKGADEGEDAEDSTANTTTVKVEKNSLPEITLGKIIDLINMIRSGKSMKDKAVLKAFKQYYQRLNGSERVALYAFLTGISGLVVEVDEEGAGSGDAGDGDTPSQDPYGIEMNKKAPKYDKEKKEKASGSAGSPIVVGERANKSREKRLLIKNR